jgi:hypothetical protein
MLTLPSGKVVDLSTDRAKYHALRLQPGMAPGPQAEHRQLYALVDVIERQIDEAGVPRRGWTEHDYRFTGYTLADIRLASDWPEGDKIVLLDWARKADQRRVIETARRRLVEYQASLSIKENSSPQHLYSLLQRQIAALSLERAGVEQWRATIANMRKKGVREEEVLWSGLAAYLARQPADTVLSKGQLMTAVDFTTIWPELSAEQRWGVDGGLCFKEVAQRMPHQVVYRAALKLDDSCHCILRYVDSTYNYRVGVVKTLAYGHSMALNKYWFVLDPYGRAIPNQQGTGLYYSGSEAAMVAAQQHARESLGMLGGVSFHTRFDHLTLYGGHDYREWLVTLPDYQRIFFGAHHFDHNVLAHIRTTSREDCAGRKLLFIEEVQSDWHQSGRRYGYDTNVWGKVANAPFKKEWPALAVKLMLIRAGQNGYDGIAWPRGDIQETRYSKSLDAIKRHYDMEIPKVLNRLGRPFECAVESTWIETRDPWLNLERSRDKWRVADGAGKFQTRAKYHSREEAMAVLARHCRSIDLEVPVFFINDALRWQIAEDGLPLFGETVAEK